MQGRVRPALFFEFGGMSMPRNHRETSWPFWPEECPCDDDFLKYLKKNEVKDKTIFHFGTGGHHILGVKNLEWGLPNGIFGITFSRPEYKAYIDFINENAVAAKSYKVMYVDIYTLTSRIIPNFDLVTLFHLCEFYHERSACAQLNDSSLLDLFLSKLNPQGRIFFYKGSSAFAKAKIIIEDFTRQGKLIQVDEYGSLLVYGKPNEKQRLASRRPVRSPHIFSAGMPMKLNYWDDSWELQIEQCPPDDDFQKYLKENEVKDKIIFHFGTGEHHILGVKNLEWGLPNEIFGVTASWPEYEAYINFIIENPLAAKSYKVMYVDIYTLTPRIIPNFDLVTLFHLCEFYDEERSAYAQLNDSSLLDLFLSKLNPQGKIFFYKYSGMYADAKARVVIKNFTEEGKMVKVDDYENLLVYSKP